MTRTICLIPGDGIGHEVIPAAVEVLRATGLELAFTQAEAGWDAFQRQGTALPPATIEAVRQADATLFGAVSSPLSPVEGYRSPIVAPSYARIFFRNALNLGLPLFEADLTQRLQDGDTVTLDVEHGTIVRGAETIQLPAPPAWVARVWRAGGMVAYYREHGAFPLEVGQP